MHEKRVYRIIYTRKAEKGLAKLASADIEKTLSHIGKLKIPFPPNLDIKKMVDASGFFRLKFSRVRVIFEVDNAEKSIWIRKIAYRKDIYR